MVYYIADIRDGRVWTWSGSQFRPIEKHEAKGYKSERVAKTTASKLIASGFAVGVTEVRSLAY